MKVLIIEDDRAVTEIVSLSFRVGWPGASLISTRLGEEGVDLVESETPDIVILDLGLPDISGFGVLKKVRAFCSVPILVLSVKGEETDIVKALEFGADEYVVKPFRQMELLARLKSLLRRQHTLERELQFTFGPFCFYVAMHKVECGDREIRLTSTESHILYHLVKNVGKVLTYTSLSRLVWGDDYPDNTDALRVHVRHLREKIEPNPSQPQYIITRTSQGYMLRKPS